MDKIDEERRPTGPTSKRVQTGPLPAGTAEELSQTSVAVMNRVTSGRITPGQALEIFALIEARHRILDAEDHEARLRAVEQRIEGRPGKETLPLRPADRPAGKRRKRENNAGRRGQ